MLRGAGGSFALRIGNMVLKYLIFVMLSRMLSVDEFGVYNFAISWLTLLVMPVLFGLDRLLVRNVAAYRHEQNWAALKGLLQFSQHFIFVLSIVIAMIALGVAWLSYKLTGHPALLNTKHVDFAEAALVTLMITMLLLPVRTILLQQQSAMQGLQHIVISQFSEQILHPVLFLGAIGLAYLATGALESAELAMALRVITAVIALGVSFHLLNQATPRLLTDIKPVIESRLWLTSAIPFAVSKGLVTLGQQIDTLMLGMLDSAEAVALYSVSQRGVQFISLLLFSVNVTLAPQIVKLHADGKHKELQRLITQSARVVLAGSIPLTIAFIVGGKLFLSIFGDGHEYVAAHTTLIILSVGQVVSTMTGSVFLLLMMTRHERQAVYGLFTSVILHILTNLVLIPAWGIEGAAVSRALAVITANLVILWFVVQRLGIHPTALGDIREWKIWQ